MSPINQNLDYHELRNAEDKEKEATGNDYAFQMPDEDDDKEERARVRKSLQAEERLHKTDSDGDVPTEENKSRVNFQLPDFPNPPT